jgi:uncharacterized OsmC-like protein
MNEVAMKMEQIVNGVNVDDIGDLVGSIQQDASLAGSRFRLTNKWVRGGNNQSRVTGFYSGGQDHEHLQEFTIEADEPPVLAGNDLAANPVEYLLSSLVACLTTSLVYHAAVRGIEIRALEARVEGDLDLRGFLGMSDEVRRGFEGIRVDFQIDTDAENVEALRELMMFSPVYDVTSNGTSVEVSIARIQP